MYVRLREGEDEEEGGILAKYFSLFTKHDLFAPLYADIKLC